LSHVACRVGDAKGKQDTWRQGARPARKAFVEVAKAIQRFEDVKFLVDAELLEDARREIPPEIEVFAAESDDCWMRDIGPTFLLPVDPNQRSPSLRGVHWGFNAWGGIEGGLYSPWDRDLTVADKGSSSSSSYLP